MDNSESVVSTRRRRHKSLIRIILMVGSIWTICVFSLYIYVYFTSPRAYPHADDLSVSLIDYSFTDRYVRRDADVSDQRFIQVVLELDIYNMSDEDVMYTSRSWTLLDAEGREYDIDILTAPWSYVPKLREYVATDSKTRSTLSFEVEQISTDYYLAFLGYEDHPILHIPIKE